MTIQDDLWNSDLMRNIQDHPEQYTERALKEALIRIRDARKHTPSAKRKKAKKKSDTICDTHQMELDFGEEKV